MATDNIMADLISKNALMEWLCLSTPSEIKGIDDVIKKVKSAPTVDAVEVVRCRECKYAKYDKDCPHRLRNHPDNYCRCNILDYTKSDDNFCSYGERKEGAE